MVKHTGNFWTFYKGCESCKEFKIYKDPEGMPRYATSHSKECPYNINWWEEEEWEK